MESQRVRRYKGVRTTVPRMGIWAAALLDRSSPHRIRSGLAALRMCDVGLVLAFIAEVFAERIVARHAKDHKQGHRPGNDSATDGIVALRT
jgi:hypothetical protein